MPEVEVGGVRYPFDYDVLEEYDDGLPAKVEVFDIEEDLDDSYGFESWLAEAMEVDLGEAVNGAFVDWQKYDRTGKIIATIDWRIHMPF